MLSNRIVPVFCSVALAAVLGWWIAMPARTAGDDAMQLPSGDFAIRAVRVFDGERVQQNVDVIVRKGRIESVAPNARIDASLPVIEGKELTLLPGLIDAHVHAFGDARRDAVRAGVTTIIDQFGDWKLLTQARRDRESLERTDAADQWGAGTLATAANGHGTQFGLDVPTLGGPGEAPAWVEARVGEGSDFIKLVREDAKLYRRPKPLPTLDRATTAAVIDAAHVQGLKAVMHVSTREHAREAFADGVDGIVHMFQDAPADAQLVQLVRERNGFVVATLAVIDSIENMAREGAAAAMQPPALTLLRDARASVRALSAAGVPILAGSDAPNFGLAHGLALHAELDQLVAAGMTPTQALTAATSAPATAFGIPERGRIAPGARADLLLVRGDPTRDIKLTRDIVAVWKNGFAIAREQAKGSAVPDLKGAPISDFAKDLSSRYGIGWSTSSDQMMGGKSSATIAHRSAGTMRVEGVIAPGFAYPWAGAMLSPGAAAVQSVDYSAHRELIFRVRGDGRRYQSMILSGSAAGGAPPSHEFETGPEWREVRIRLDGFAGADLERVWGVGFNAASPAGAFWFELDDVVVE